MKGEWEGDRVRQCEPTGRQAPARAQRAHPRLTHAIGRRRGATDERKEHDRGGVGGAGSGQDTASRIGQAHRLPILASAR